MSAPLSDALQDCLDRLEGGQSLDAVLARYPDQRDDLAPLLVAARAVRDHRPTPPPSFRARLQAELAESDLWPDEPAPETLPRQGVWRPWMLRLTGVLTAVVATLGFLVAASADSQPGDLLHPVRRTAERAVMGASRSFGPVIDVLQPYRRPVSIRAGGDEPTPSTDPSAAPDLEVDARPRVTVRHGTGEQPEVPDESSGGSARWGGVSSVSDGEARTAATAAARAPAGPAASDAGSGEAHDPTGSVVPAHVGAPGDPTEEAASVSSAASAPARGVMASPTTPSVTLTETPAQEPSAVLSVAQTPTRRSRPSPSPGSAARGRIEGRVTVFDGRPVPRATLIAVPADRPPGGRGLPADPKRYAARTGADGRYAITGLPPGRYRVALLSGPGNEPIMWYHNADDPREAEVLTLDAGGSLKGIDFRVRLRDWHRLSHALPGVPWP